MDSPNITHSPVTIPEKRISLTMKKYDKIVAQNKNVGNTKDTTLKKLMLDLLKDRPQMWKNRDNRRINDNEWKTLAKEIYERTGTVVNVADLRTMLRNAKTVLMNKLRTCIKKNFDREKTLKCLQSWEFFAHFEWFYATLKEYESKLRGETSANQDTEESEDEDIIFIETVENEDGEDVRNTMGMNRVKVEPTGIDDGPEESKPCNLLQEAVVQRDSRLLSEAFNNLAPAIKRERGDEDDDEEIYLKDFQLKIRRLNLEEPGRANILNFVINKLAWAFEDGHYPNMEIMFHSLAEKAARENSRQSD